jgi:hypothetical protein
MFPNDAIYRRFLYQRLPAPPKTVGTSADIQALKLVRSFFCAPSVSYITDW